MLWEVETGWSAVLLRVSCAALEPFRPFVVHVADGGSLLVKHEDFAALVPSGREMLIYRHDRPDDYEVVDVPLVTRIEVTSENGTKKPRK